MPSPDQHLLDSFFAAYASRLNQALADPPVIDVDGVTGSFTDRFIEASPLGVNCGQNNEDFRAVIPQGYAFYRSIGTQSMEIASMTPTPLDEYHALARVHWVARYRKQDSSEDVIEFDVIYLVQILNNTPEIFAYITGDEQKVLREHDLLPDEPSR